MLIFEYINVDFMWATTVELIKENISIKVWDVMHPRKKIKILMPEHIPLMYSDSTISIFNISDS